MTGLRKALAMFLAVMMLLSSLSVAGFAVTDEVAYTVETYYMDTSGNYRNPTVNEYYAAAGEVISLTPEEISGYTFDSAKSVTEFTVDANGSSVGKIYYSRNKYTATYIYEDLLGPQTEISIVYYGAEIPSFEANPSGKPAKQGYNFIMWSLEENSRVEVPSRMPAKDINMYPVYEIKTYTYTFDAGEGGKFSDGERYLTVEYTYGDTPEFPENPTMPHNEFIDWDNNLPATVTGNMNFTAIYNELTYAAIFMDGEEEVGYMDGYYYGDIIEELDIPEGYEAWKLSDGTYAEFPYTVTGNTVFYAADAPSEYTVRFLLDVNDTEPYEEFTVLQGDEIDFPADPEKTGYVFVGWNPDITVMPDEDVDFVAEWEALTYTVTFDTNGGNEMSPVEFTVGEEIELPVNPSRDGFVFAGWEGMPEDGLMPAENITLTAKWEKTVAADSLSFKTELYTYDEASDEWVIADSVERGEKVKARIYIETGFAVGSGQVLCFFDDDVFTIENTASSPLVLNDSPDSTTSQYYISGNYSTPSKTGPTYSDLVYFGYITQEFLDSHTPVTFTFTFADYKCHSINGDEWFAEFELTAKDDAAGTGDFFVVPETIVNSEEGYYAYITLSKGEEGGSSIDAEGMFSWNATTSVESHPVSTGYGRIILDAGEGEFSSDNSDIFVVDAKVGDSVIYEYPCREGYKFYGWDTEIPDIMPEEIIKAEALWTACTDTQFKVTTHYYDFCDDEGVLTEETFEYTGTTGYTIEIVEVIPATPDENTVYVLLSDFAFDYNVIDTDAANVFNGYINADGTTVLDIYFIPVTHIVIFDSNGGGFSDGDTVKYIEVSHGELAADNVPYAVPYKDGYKFNGWLGLEEDTRIVSDITFAAAWAGNTYIVTFDANGGEFADGSGYITSEVEFESTVYTPSHTPVRDGYEFMGWSDENGNIYNDGNVLGIMPDKDIVFTAVWNEIIEIYQARFDANGGIFEDGLSYALIDAEKGSEIVIPTPVMREGYEFYGWYLNGVKYEPGSSFVIPANDVVFTCVWIEITTEATTETTTEPTTQPTTVTTTEPTTKETTTQPAAESTTAVTEPSTTEPVTEPVTEPATTEPVTEPSTEATTVPTTKPTTKPTTQPTTKPAEPTTVPTTVHTHSLKTVVENASCEKAGKKYQVCKDCGETVGEITVIAALGHSAGDWQTVTQPTYQAEGKKIKKCTRCYKTVEEASIPVLDKLDLEIKTPSVTTIKYGDGIYLHAETELPAGSKVVWEANNGNFTYTVSGDGMTCLISPAASGSTTFTAKVVDNKGYVISDEATQVMTSKAGFFQKIIAFFKKLFGLTKVYPDALKNVYFN